MLCVDNHKIYEIIIGKIWLNPFCESEENDEKHAQFSARKFVVLNFGCYNQDQLLDFV